MLKKIQLFPQRSIPPQAHLFMFSHKIPPPIPDVMATSLQLSQASLSHLTTVIDSLIKSFVTTYEMDAYTTGHLHKRCYKLFYSH